MGMTSEQLMRHRREIGDESRLLSALLADAIVATQDTEKERDAALAEARRHKAELDKWCADAERLMDDVVLPKSKAIEEERDAALGRVETFEALYKVMDASADRYRVALDEIQDALGWPDCSKLSLIGEVKRLKAAESKEGGA